MLAAHDAGEPQRLRFVGDEQQVGVEIEHLAVEQRQLLAAARKADDDVALEQRVVVGVQRLALLEHDVIGDVDHRGNRADPRALQASPHPFGRRRLGVDALDHAAAKARTRDGILDPNVATRLCLHRDGVDRRRAERRLGDRGNLARDAEDRKAIGAIRRELEREQRIVEIERRAQIRARLQFRVEQQ